MSVDALAKRALAAWGYDPAAATLTVLGEANNTVYRVEFPDGAAQVVRVHRPNHKTRRWVETELSLLAHLYRAGVAVPPPLAEVVEIKGDDGAPRLCTLLGALPGVVKPALDWYALLAHRAGEYLGALHLAARSFELTPGLDRPLLDAETLFSPATQYALDSEGEALLAPYADVFSRVRSRAADAFSALDNLGVPMQPIHGDYRPDNLLWSRLTPAAVDFDDCVWGSPAYDLATLWLFLRPHQRYVQLKIYALRAWCVAVGLDESATLLTACEELVTARVALSCRWVAGNRHHPALAGRAEAIIAERIANL